MDIISEIPQERTQPTAVAFGETLWHFTVARLVYSLKDGSEITVMYDLSENRKVPERHQGSMLFGAALCCPKS
jgi:hypothetical protein